MNKGEFISAVAANAGVTKEMAAKCYEGVVATIAKAMADGEKVSLVGFGNFEARDRAARMGINPATKEKIEIAASKSIVFKASKAMKDNL